jgi:hypothetical protein
MGKATKSIISSISTLRTRANNLSNFDVAELAELDTIAEWPQPVRQFLLLGTLLLGLLKGVFLFSFGASKGNRSRSGARGSVEGRLHS